MAEFVTKGGRVLTDADIEALADEAERGHPDTVMERVEFWNVDVRYKAPELLEGQPGLRYFRAFFVDVMRAAGYEDVASAIEAEE